MFSFYLKGASLIFGSAFYPVFMQVGEDWYSCRKVVTEFPEDGKNLLKFEINEHERAFFASSIKYDHLPEFVLTDKTKVFLSKRTEENM